MAEAFDKRKLTEWVHVTRKENLDAIKRDRELRLCGSQAEVYDGVLSHALAPRGVWFFANCHDRKNISKILYDQEEDVAKEKDEAVIERKESLDANGSDIGSTRNAGKRVAPELPLPQNQNATTVGPLTSSGRQKMTSCGVLEDIRVLLPSIQDYDGRTQRKPTFVWVAFQVADVLEGGYRQIKYALVVEESPEFYWFLSRCFPNEDVQVRMVEGECIHENGKTVEHQAASSSSNTPAAAGSPHADDLHRSSSSSSVHSDRTNDPSMQPDVNYCRLVRRCLYRVEENGNGANKKPGTHGLVDVVQSDDYMTFSQRVPFNDFQKATGSDTRCYFGEASNLEPFESASSVPPVNQRSSSSSDHVEPPLFHPSTKGLLPGSSSNSKVPTLGDPKRKFNLNIGEHIESPQTGRPTKVEIPFDKVITWNVVDALQSGIIVSVFVIPPHGSCITFQPEHDEVVNLSGYAKDDMSCPKINEKTFQNILQSPLMSARSPSVGTTAVPPMDTPGANTPGPGQNSFATFQDISGSRLSDSSAKTPNRTICEASPMACQELVSAQTDVTSLAGTDSGNQNKNIGSPREIPLSHANGSSATCLTPFSQVESVGSTVFDTNMYIPPAYLEAKKMVRKRKENSGIVQLYRHKVTLMRWKLSKELHHARTNAAQNTNDVSSYLRRVGSQAGLDSVAENRNQETLGKLRG